MLSVDPPADEGQAGLRAVALAMKAMPHPSTGKLRALPPEAETSGGLFEGPSDAEAPDWDASLDEDIDEAFDPPRPLPFQKED